MHRATRLMLTVVGVAALFLASSCTTPANNPPVIASLQTSAEQVAPLGSIQVVCTASDLDGDELSYTWSASAGEVASNADTLTWTAPASDGSHTVAVVVTDGRGGETMDYVTITVGANNNPPTIADLTADTEWTTPLSVIQVTCSASDLDGDGLVYEWSASGGEISGQGDTITWQAPASEGSYSVAVTVTDVRGGETMDYVTITVGANNNPPIIADLTADTEWTTPSNSLQLVCTASDPDSDDLSYDWSASAGEISGGGTAVIWTAPASEGSYIVAVLVTDGRGAQATDSVTIAVRVNNAPEIASLTANPGWTTPSEILQATCTASDPDNDDLSYSWTAIEGSISGTGAVISWTAPQQVGIYNITVVVTDGYGGSATETLSVDVLTGQPPIIETLLITADHCYLKPYSGGYYVGKEQVYDIECIVSDTYATLSYEWSCTGGELSGQGSLITWAAPDTAGYVTVTVIVSDIADNTTSKDVTLNVVPCSYCIFGC